MLVEKHRKILLGVARTSICHGLSSVWPLIVDPTDYPEPLRDNRATFVTLNRNGRLRGCIGCPEAERSLVSDVAANAHAAAFFDPRFPPLADEEVPDLEIHISVLSRPRAMTFNSEDDLAAQLRPGVDGLILEDKGRRGTFLPSVWKSLPDPVGFLRQLKVKAGLHPGYWSDTLTVSRYTAEYFGAAWESAAPSS